MATSINRKILLATHAQLIKQGVKYGYGAKAEGGRDPRNGRKWNHRSTGRISTPVDTIDNIDCSGLMRYEAYLATGADWNMVDGSQAQRSWCQRNFEECDYSDFRYSDNVLRIGFMTPGIKGVGSIGHVWWGFNGNTMESYGGHGVGSHRWDVYAHRVSSCYIVPSHSGAGETVPGATAKEPRLVIGLTTGPGAIEYHDVKSAKLDRVSRHYKVNPSELIQLLMLDSDDPVEVRKVLEAIRIKPYDTVNKLDDKSDPRVIMFFNTTRA